LLTNGDDYSHGVFHLTRKKLKNKQMKPSFEQIKKNPSKSLLNQVILNLPEFEPYWHFHPEYEITYIINGSGKRIVGDSIEPFGPGDLVLLGTELPHTWNSVRSDQEKGNCKAVVFQFNSGMIPDSKNWFPEFENLQRLLVKAYRGISFSGQKATEIGKKLEKLPKVEGLQKLTRFWLILDELSRVGEYKFLASEGYAPSLNKFNGERINKVFKFVSEHFAEDIKLRQIASLTHMTETSFSRFFKKITGESFMDYLNSYRISKACALLAEKREMSILEIAYKSGFKSSTHFNRMFLNKKCCTPTHFRRQHFA
jgi:AraC-like DNA-binding protein/mannose-6-phosphate isomerase-like protein (cupin superfamily)